MIRSVRLWRVALTLGFGVGPRHVTLALGFDFVALALVYSLGMGLWRCTMVCCFDVGL